MSVNDDIIITASAGTGKTYRLVSHYLAIFNESFRRKDNLDVHNVLCITFTKKAAREMKERIVKEIDSKFQTSRRPQWQELRRRMPFAWISTIHSFCERLLRESALHLSLDPGFEIVDGMDYYSRLMSLVRSYFEEHIDELGELLSVTGIGSALKLLKLSLTSYRYEILSKSPLPAETVSDTGSSRVDSLERASLLLKQHASELLRLFRSEFTQANQLDFDELLLKTRDLLEENPEVRERYSERFRYVPVDEFQDTDGLQTQIINLLHRPGRNFRLFVGDPKQSIYAFRGADVAVFNRTREKFVRSGLPTETLNTNFRSKERLVSFQNELFSMIMPDAPVGEHFRTSYSSKVTALQENSSTPDPRVKLLLSKSSDDSENVARFVSDLLETKMTMKDRNGEEEEREVKPRDIALLLRKFSKISAYEAALSRFRVPFFTSGSKGFFERPEVNGILSWLEFIADPLDDGAFVRLAMSPAFRLSLDRLFSLKKGNSHFIEGILDEDYEEPELLRRLLLKHRELKHVTRPSVLVEKFIAESNYLARLAVLPDADRMTANTLKLVDMIKELERRKNGLRDLLSSFRSFDEFSEEPEAALEAESSDSVKIMTVHQSKALEFPIVVLGDCFWKAKPLQAPFISFDDRSFLIIPKEHEGEALSSIAERMKSLENEKRYEEEKRTLYVAVSRARDLLAMSLNGDPAESKPWSKMLKDKLFNPDEMSVTDIMSDHAETVKPGGKKYVPKAPVSETSEEIDTSMVPSISPVSLGKYVSPTRLISDHGDFFELGSFFELERNTLIARRDLTFAGEFAHKILEELGHKGKGIPENSLVELFQTIPTPALFEDPISDEEKEEVLSALRKLAEHPLLKEIIAGEHVFSEISVQRKLDDFILLGVIDKLYSIDGKWNIVDFKYSNRDRKKEKMYSFQLEFYLYLLKSTLPVEKATVIYLKSGETLEVSLESTKEYERLLRELIYGRGGVVDET